jgi:hypothetical protein
MQYITYNNINFRFTFNNIWSLLTKFLINEIISKKEYSKLLLTIVVIDSNNKSFTLINNLSFNINGYTDVLIIIKQFFETNIFNDQNILYSIVFKYYFEYKDDYKKSLYITNIYIYLLQY